MGKIEIDLQKMTTLEQEIEILEKRKKTLESELESLTKECNSLKDITNKEIAQQKQVCDSECQEKIVNADKILKNAENKNKTADKREEESKIIGEQIKALDKKIEEFKKYEQSIEAVKIAYLEKERKATLLIEQYTKKLEEVNKK